MRVVIGGGHGKVARAIERQLADRGDEAVGLVRNSAHVPVLTELGAQAVVVDLESATVEAVAEALPGADAVVFAAGAGPGSGPARKLTVDRDAAIKLVDAARAAGVRRYVMISAMGADDASADADDDFAVYLRAKADADRALRASGLDWTIIRPGGLTDDPATGCVRVAERTGRGRIPRADVASVVLRVLDSPATIRAQFELISGDTRISDALPM